MWNNKFELTYGSYSALDIEGYFEYIIKKHKAVTVNLPMKISVSKI